VSTDTPETKNPFKARAEAVDRAVKAWQEQDFTEVPLPDGGRLVPATLEDCLNDEGLILLPRSTGRGKWVVEVDGQRAPIAPGSDRPTGLLDAEEAADLFLTITGADEYGMKQVTVRPATEWEWKMALQAHLFGGVA
jgi:hypothetical protein